MRVDVNKDLGMAVLIAKALSSPIRLEILLLLRKKPSSLGEITSAVRRQAYRATVYRHMEKLKRAALVEQYYDGQTKQLMYRLNTTKVNFEL